MQRIAVPMMLYPGDDLFRGHCEMKRRAPTDFAFDPDPSAMPFDQGFRYEQT
jgi:hypothetical protein